MRYYHHGMLNRMCALALLLLVVSPATAPFQTIDLRPLSVDIITPGPAADTAVAPAAEVFRAKLVPAPAVVASTSMAVPPSIAYLGGPLARSCSIADRPLYTTILRL